MAKIITMLAAVGENETPSNQRPVCIADDNRWTLAWLVIKFKKATWPFDKARIEKLFTTLSKAGAPAFILSLFLIKLIPGLDRWGNSLGYMIVSVLLGSVVVEFLDSYRGIYLLEVARESFAVSICLFGGFAVVI